jgi:Lipid A 3-O-deacylase (PagL)
LRCTRVLGRRRASNLRLRLIKSPPNSAGKNLRELTIDIVILIVVFSPVSSGQTTSLPTQSKGTRDVQIWLGGVAAQHDGTTSFTTDILMGGVAFGRILTEPHGPGWARGTLQWGVNLLPLFVVSNLQTTYGAEVDPIVIGWNLRPRRQSEPYFEMAGGLLVTNAKIPPGDTSKFNIIPKVGFGWHIFRHERSCVDLGVRAWHLSNAWTAPRNPSANGVQVTVGYHWFALPKRVSQTTRAMR